MNTWILTVIITFSQVPLPITYHIYARSEDECEIRAVAAIDDAHRRGSDDVETTCEEVLTEL